MFWWIHLLGFLFVLGFVNALNIILPNTITLGTVTTINFIGSTGDPPAWILVNVYENATTQIGSSTFSGSGSTTMTFIRDGPHFLQAFASANGVLSFPFYAGNFFIPVDPSVPSSTSSITTVTQTVQVSTATCSSSSAAATTPKTIDIGTVVGAVIGALGFLTGLVFFLLWRNQRRNYKQSNQSLLFLDPLSSASVTNGMSDSTESNFYGHRPSLPPDSFNDTREPTPLMQSIPENGRELPPISPNREIKRRVVSPSETGTDSSGSTNVSSPRLTREVSQLRRELNELRQGIMPPYDIAPPSY